MANRENLKRFWSNCVDLSISPRCLRIERLRNFSFCVSQVGVNLNSPRAFKQRASAFRRQMMLAKRRYNQSCHATGCSLCFFEMQIITIYVVRGSGHYPQASLGSEVKALFAHEHEVSALNVISSIFFPSFTKANRCCGNFSIESFSSSTAPYQIRSHFCKTIGKA